MPKHTADEIVTATRALTAAFPVGAKVTTLTMHNTGASASVRVLHGDADGGVTDLSWAVARVLGWRFDRKRGGVWVTGGNIDYGHHIVYTLARALYPQATVDTLTQNRI